MGRSDTISDLKRVLEELEEERDVLNLEIDSIRSAVNILESRPEVEYASSKQAQALRDSIYEILSEQHPLHRRTIYDRLVERGVKVGGQDPVNNVGAHLSRDSRFRNVGRGEWDLDERYIERVNEIEGYGTSKDAEVAVVTEQPETIWPPPYGGSYQRPVSYSDRTPVIDDADDLPW